MPYVNTQLIEGLKKFIRNNPDKFDMHTTMTPEGGCIAGITCHLADRKPCTDSNNWQSTRYVVDKGGMRAVEVAAMDLLGIPDDIALSLFFFDHWPVDAQAQYHLDPVGTTIARIDEMIAQVK